MVLQNAANSFFMQLHLLFPGTWPCNIGVFYISLSIDRKRRIQPHSLAMQRRAVDGVYLRGRI